MGDNTLNKAMKLPPSQWVAHDCTKTNVVPKTMRGSLLETKAAYIWQKIVPQDVVDKITIQLVQSGTKPSCQDLVDEYEELIPDNIKFIIVTLQPRWDSEI